MAQNVFPALRYRDARAAIEFLKSAAGFEELTDQDYGSREYAIRDPEGSVWTFGTY